MRVGAGHEELRRGGLLLAVAIGISCRAAPSNDRGGDADIPVTLDLSKPPALSAGRSTLESRYVYAPPDEGEFTVPLSLDFSLPGEFSIQEPSMVSGSATVYVSYSKSRNVVDVKLEAHGLPYRPTFTKEVDDSTPFNRQPRTVQSARWRLWMMGTFFGRQHEDVYYQSRTPRVFLGSRYDIEPLGPNRSLLIGTYDILQGNARQMVGSAAFDPQPNGEASFGFALPYDRISDAQGTPGTLNIVLPLDTCAPDALVNYWTERRLPPEKFMTWDTFLSSIWNGEGIGFALTAEPDDRSLRSSTFTGWGNVYPAAVPRGFGMDFCTFGTLIPIRASSYQLDLWPATSRRKLCRT
jgi:hypothetical protein